MTDNPPYLGLRPFNEEEKDKFFGRKPEIHILTDKILAHRVTLLVAASGVGKSSLLQAGVMPALRATGLADLVYHNDWALNPAEALKKTIVAHFIAQQRVNADYQADFSLPLPEFLQLHALLGTGTLVVLLDQFEEFFYYQRFSQQRDEFIRQLAGAIQDSNTPTAFVFSMREDFAMEMEAFKPHFTGIFSNIYRIEKLSLEAARLAIVGPGQEEPGRVARFTYQPDLLKRLLNDFGRRELDESLGLYPKDDKNLPPLLVEPPHLQIVCQQLWEAAMASTESEITTQHYEQLGCADGILTRYFDDKMATLNTSQQRLASRAFDLLVSQHGAKMPYPLVELVKLLNEDEEPLKNTLEELQKAAILRRMQRQGQPWYELYHDIFAKRIVEWNQAYKHTQRQQQNRQLIIRSIVPLLAGLAIVVACYWEMINHSRYLRLGKVAVSDQVELYQGQSGNQDIFHLQKFVYESDYERSDIEADKRFETAAIAENEQTAVIQIGLLPLTQRYAAYAESGLFTHADKLFDAIHKAEDKSLISGLATQLGVTRLRKTVDHLQALLKDDDTNVRRASIKGLADLKAQAIIQPLLVLLKDEDADVRESTIQAMTDLKSESTIRPLLALLKGNDPIVRSAVIRTLSNIKSQALMQPLLALLKNDNANVRGAVIRVLGNLNAQVLIQYLPDLLADGDSEVRNGAIEVLGKIKGQAAIQLLLTLLENGNAEVRSSAIEALGHLKAKAAIQPLLAKLEDDNPNVRCSAIQALVNLKAQPAIQPLLALLKGSDATVRNAVIQALGNLKAQAAIQPLLALLNGNNASVRRTVIQALGNLKTQAAIQPLLALLQDHDVDVRNAAIQALTNLKAQAAIQPLLNLLKGDEAAVRVVAISALGNLKAQDAIQSLLAFLEDQDDYVRKAAIQALTDLHAQAAIQHLLTLLEDDNAYVRSAAIQVLGNLKNNVAIQRIQALLNDHNADVRRDAIRALDNLKAQVVITRLDLLNDTDDNVRKAAIWALCNLKAQAAIQSLLDLQKDNDGGVRREAIYALKKMEVVISGSETPPQINVGFHFKPGQFSKTMGYE